IGAHSFSGMGSGIGKDVPAFMMVYGNPAEPRGINIEGLRRRGFTSDEIMAVRRAYKTVYRQGLTTEQALGELRARLDQHPELELLVASLEQSRRGIVR